MGLKRTKALTVRAIWKVQKSYLCHCDGVCQMVSLLIQSVKSSCGETEYKHRHNDSCKRVIAVEWEAGQAKVWSQKVRVFYLLAFKHVE